MSQHPDCTPNDLLHMIDAPTTRRPEDMTIEEMAVALGLRRDTDGDWVNADGDPLACDWDNGRWASWPTAASDEGRQEHPSEHAAMSRLYHLRFPETGAPPTPAPIVEPSPVQRGGNVALVMRAYAAWKADDETDHPNLNSHVERAFGEMLAEAYVADAKEQP